MKKGLSKHIGVICMAALAAALLTGCARVKVPEEVNTTSIIISNKGEVTSHLIDVFDKDYYSISDLTAMAIKEAADYNTEHQQGESVPVTVEKVEAKADGSGKVVVIHKYDTAETYADFNEAILFFGKASDAVGDVSDRIDPRLVNVKDGTQITEEKLQSALKDKHVIITDAKAVFYCPYGVAYVSEGVVYQEDGTVDTSQAEGTVTILMKE